MDPIAIALVSIGLAMDSAAASVAGGINAKNLVRGAFYGGAVFGAFQGLMFFAGGAGGALLKESIEDIDHWIAFALLALVGGRMIFEASLSRKRQEFDILEPKTLVIVGIATSIDALAVGAGMVLGDESLPYGAIIVGAVTFAICFAAAFMGRRYGPGLGWKAEAAGGLLLVLTGLNILVSHIY